MKDWKCKKLHINNIKLVTWDGGAHELIVARSCQANHSEAASLWLVTPKQDVIGNHQRLRRKLPCSNLHTPEVIRLASVFNWYLVNGNQWTFHFAYTDENDLFNFAEISYAVNNRNDRYFSCYSLIISFIPTSLVMPTSGGIFIYVSVCCVSSAVICCYICNLTNFLFLRVRLFFYT